MSDQFEPTVDQEAVEQPILTGDRHALRLRESARWRYGRLRTHEHNAHEVPAQVRQSPDSVGGHDLGGTGASGVEMRVGAGENRDARELNRRWLEHEVHDQSLA